MIIKVDKIRIQFDETLKEPITPKYLGKSKDILAVKEKLEDASGMYGHSFTPNGSCLASDLVVAIITTFPNTEIPKYDYYNPPIPPGAIH